MLTKVIKHIQANQMQYIVAIAIGLIESAILWNLAGAQGTSFIDFLSARIPVRGWLLVFTSLLVIVVIAVLSGFLWPHVARKSIEDVVNKKLSIGSIRLDGKRFIRCEFDGSNLVYSGQRPVELEQCSLREVRLTLDGPAASTLNFLATMYRNMDEAGRKHLEAAVEDIRQGRHINKESYYI
jgi:hypothetical protein